MAITRLHVWVALICAMALAADVAEISLGSALSVVFSAAPYHMEPGRLSWLLAAVYGGAVIGAPALGLIADRIGVKRTLTGALCWLTITSLLAAGVNAQSDSLIALRLMSGISLGALPPLVVAYLTDISPPRIRGAYILSVCAVALLAGPAVVFFVRLLTPFGPWGIEGWRWPLVMAGVLTLFAGVAFAFVPESLAIRCQKSRVGFAAQGEDGGERDPPPVLTSQRYVRRIVIVALVYFLQPWAQLGFALLSGPILLRRGIEPSNALSYVGFLSFGPAIGALIAGAFLDRLPRRSVLIACGILMLTAAIYFFSVEGEDFTPAIFALFGICAGLYVPLMSIYGAECFPTRIRASATSGAWGINRFGSVLVPLALLPLLRAQGPQRVADCIYLSLALSTAVLACFGPASVSGRFVE